MQQEIFAVFNIDEFKQQALCWSRKFSMHCLLDHNNSLNSEMRFPCILATDPQDTFLHEIDEFSPGFDALQEWLTREQDWAFGFFSYDLKNELEPLQTTSPDFHQFPLIHFFRPGILIFFEGNRVRIESKKFAPEEIFAEIINTEIPAPSVLPPISLLPQFSKEEYLDAVKQIKQHIQHGDIYEMNFCQAFCAEQVSIDPYALFSSLNELSRSPFASFFKYNEQYLLCGSPERFLKRSGRRLLSQPIKGTRARHEEPHADLWERKSLEASAKDRSENVMIVDLVRNDLARSCLPGSIRVEELFGIYSFKTVHQMISSISGQLRADVSGVDAIRYAFPMGSMTGAPKIRAMELIDRYERNARGLYSGAVGCFTPHGDFDFNVVIRSILYGADQGRLSFQVGGAIVTESIPEQEYEECIVKAKAMMQALGLKQLMPDLQQA